MKKACWFVVASLALALSAGAVFAQGSSNRITANVPFSFFVGKTELPAGHYEVFQPVDTVLDLVIRNTDTGKFALVQVISWTQSKDPGNAELVFRKIDDKSYLWEVLPRWSDGYEVAGSRVKHPASTASLSKTSVSGE